MNADDLIARVQAGDRGAFAEWVEASAPRVRRLAARLLGDLDDAEDVLQEAYVRAHAALIARKFDGRASAETWLYRIVTNLAISELRARRRRRPLEPLPTERDGRPELEARLALRELGALVDQLPPEQRAALILKELEERTAPEIAALLGCSEGAVEQRLVRARAALRERIGRDE